MRTVQGFYINLPFGAIFAPAYLFLLPSINPEPDLAFVEKLRLIDWLGAVVFLAGSACLTVALTFGGVIYPFGSATIIVLWSVTGVLLIAFTLLLRVHPFVEKKNRIYPVHFFKSFTLFNMQLQVFLASGIILVSALSCRP
jgi:hypothetical protein